MVKNLFAKGESKMANISSTNRPILILLVVAMIYHLAIWTDLVATLNYWGFEHSSTSLQLGLIVMAFSGSMALAGALTTGKFQSHYRLILLLSAVVSAICMAAYPAFTSLNTGILLILIKGACIGCFASAQNTMVERLTTSEQFEKVDQLFEWWSAVFKFVGPLLAALLVIQAGQLSITITVWIYAISIVPIFFLPVIPKKSQQKSMPEPESKAMPSTSVPSIAYAGIGMIVMAAMSFFVTIGDSQLVILFRDVYTWNNAGAVALVMAAAGIGTFIIRLLTLSKRIEKVGYYWIGISCIGLASIFFLVTWAMLVHASIIYILLLFMLGGMFWQLGFSLYLNRITGHTAWGAKFGIVMAITYILGPLFGGVGVKLSSIEQVYGITGICLLGFGVAFALIYVSHRFTQIKANRG